MDSKLLLIKSIMLLYRESELDNNMVNSNELVREIIDGVKLNDSSIQSGDSREALIALRSTAIWMAEEPPETKYDAEMILQRLRVNIGEDNVLFSAVESGMNTIVEQDRILRICNEHRNTLLQYLNRNKIKKVIKDASRDVLFDEENVDWRNFTADVIQKLEPYVSGAITDTAGQVTNLDISDTEALKAVIKEGQESNSIEGIMKTGWQGFNRMMGDYNGMRRGDMILIGALQHNYKSGMLMQIPKHVALYNKPYMIDPTKKPLIINISLENKVQDNILILYKNLKENETGVECDITSLDIQEAADYISSQLGINGYHYRLLRYDPTEFTFRRLISLLDGFLADGYEIHLVSIDYLNMMSKEGCQGANDAGRIRDLFRRVRSYCNPKHITCLTAHQLSSDAKYLIRQGAEDFVKEIANKGYYDSAKGIDQEVDVEVSIHIEKPGDDRSYLTMMRGKHRKSGKITPENDLYCVYRFEPIGDIPDDVNGNDLSRKRVGAATRGSGNADETAWWDTAKV